MPSHTYTKGTPILDDSSITGDVYSDIIHPTKAGFSLTYNSNSAGNLVAVLYLQCRNHPDESFVNCNNASFPSHPDGSAGSDEYSLVDTNHAEYRVHVDFTSGDGELTMYLKLAG